MRPVYILVLALLCCDLQSVHSQQAGPAGSLTQPSSSTVTKANPLHKSPAKPDLMPVDPSTGGGCMGGGTCSDDSESNKLNDQRMHLPLIISPIKDANEVSEQQIYSMKPEILGPQQSMARPRCVAEQTLKNLPHTMKLRARKFIESSAVRSCANIVKTLIETRENLSEAYKALPPRRLDTSYRDLAASYKQHCLSPELIQEGVKLTKLDRAFLFHHVGLIVRRVRPEWRQPEPICHAFRSGGFAITALHCLTEEVLSDIDEMNNPPDDPYAPGVYLEPLAFRSLNSPTLYGLKLVGSGVAGDPLTREGRGKDYAIFSILGLSAKNSFEFDRIGHPKLFADFVILQSNLYSRIVNDIHSGSAESFSKTLTVEQSILCRPAHITADGLFLHACQTEGKTSGAPIFQKQNGKLQLVGLHTGVTESIEQPEVAACVHLPNYGVSLSVEKIRQLIEAAAR